MVISGMNRFFARHGRVTLGVLVIIISVSFVLYLSAGASAFNLFSFRVRSQVGTVFGQGVSREELQLEADRAIISACLASPFLSPGQVPREQVLPMAAMRLVQLRAAQRRGLDAAPEAVAARLHEAPVFMRDGKFDRDTFRRYISTQLEPAGFTAEDLDEAVRGDLVIERLREEVTAAALASPQELRDAFNEENERFQVVAVRFAPVPPDSIAAPDEERLAGFFAQRREQYRIPPRCRVELVRFNHLALLPAAREAITAEQVRKYYDEHQGEFTVGEGDAATTQPFEQVQERIAKRLAEERAKDDARRLAEDFADAAFNQAEEAAERVRRGGDPRAARLAAFRECATAHGQQSQTIDWFRLDARTIPRVGAEPELVRTVADLYPDQPISPGIGGRRAAFVAFLLDREEERPAELAEVRDQVLSDWREEQARNLLREQARAGCLKLTETLDAGAELTPVAATVGATLEPVPEFSRAQPPKVKDGSLIGEIATATAAGRLSEPRDLPREPGALAVLVTRRTLPTEEEFTQQQTSFSARYLRWKAGSAWLGLSSWLESQAQFALQR